MEVQDGELVGDQRLQDGQCRPMLSGGLRWLRCGVRAPAGSARPGSCGLFAGVEDLADLCALGAAAVALSGQPEMVEAGGPGWVPPGGKELIARGEFGVGNLSAVQARPSSPVSSWAPWATGYAARPPERIDRRLSWRHVR
jgi:hypothetical protein